MVNCRPKYPCRIGDTLDTCGVQRVLPCKAGIDPFSLWPDGSVFSPRFCVFADDVRIEVFDERAPTTSGCIGTDCDCPYPECLLNQEDGKLIGKVEDLLTDTQAGGAAGNDQCSVVPRPIEVERQKRQRRTSPLIVPHCMHLCHNLSPDSLHQRAPFCGRAAMTRED